MKTESQVCSLEQAKKLKWLGIEQKSEFYFRGTQVWHFNEVTDWPTQEQLFNLIASGDESENILSTFTVAELGTILCEYCNFITNGGATNCWTIKYEHRTLTSPEKNYGTGTTLYQITCMTQANAMASLLIYLFENKLVTLEDCNNRLNN